MADKIPQLEEGFPVLLVIHVRGCHEGIFTSSGSSRTFVVGAQLIRRSTDTLLQRRQHIVRAGQQHVIGVVSRYDHDDVSADTELHAGHVAHQFERVIEIDEARA